MVIHSHTSYIVIITNTHRTYLGVKSIFDLVIKPAWEKISSQRWEQSNEYSKKTMSLIKSHGHNAQYLRVIL